MKIAITGGTAGIGQSIGDIYESQGHEVLRLSRRVGCNIRSVPKAAEMIERSDMFINNAQAGFAQTELLFEMWRRWNGQKKHIVVISSMMTLLPVSNMQDMDEYWLQKRTLEEACSQLRNKSNWPKITIIRPGEVGTQPGKENQGANVREWAELAVSCLSLGSTGLEITDFSIRARQNES